MNFIRSYAGFLIVALCYNSAFAQEIIYQEILSDSNALICTESISVGSNLPSKEGAQKFPEGVSTNRTKFVKTFTLRSAGDIGEGLALWEKSVAFHVQTDHLFRLKIHDVLLLKEDNEVLVLYSFLENLYLDRVCRPDVLKEYHLQESHMIRHLPFGESLIHGEIIFNRQLFVFAESVSSGAEIWRFYQESIKLLYREGGRVYPPLEVPDGSGKSMIKVPYTRGGGGNGPIKENPWVKKEQGSEKGSE